MKKVQKISIFLLIVSVIGILLTQFIFKVADGIGKAITPVFVYYIINIKRCKT